MNNEEKLNILLFIDWFLPGTNSGGPVRSYANMANHMKEILNFYVVTRDTDYCSTVPYDVDYGKWNQLSENLFVRYLKKDEISIKCFRQLSEKINFHKIYVNGIYSYKFSILPFFSFSKRRTDIIVSARGMLNPQAFSVKGIRKKIFLLVAKNFRFYKDITFHATNEDEAGYIRKRLGENARIKIAPNFPRVLAVETEQRDAKTSGYLRLVNIARISREKGTLLMLSLLNRVNEGKIVLDIFGPVYDQEYWLECKQLIDQLPGSIKVRYQGIIESDKVPVALKKYHLFIMPSEGENFGHSILEALSVGLPVIISNRTPWVNLEEQNVGWDIELSNENKFVDAINFALNMENDEYKKWSNSARKYAKKVIDDPKTFKQNKKLFNDS